MITDQPDYGKRAMPDAINPKTLSITERPWFKVLSAICVVLMILLAMLVLSMWISPAKADTITIGDSSRQNCMPFGCPIFGQSITEYQQIYSNQSFSSPMAIDTISFFPTGTGPIDSALYTMGLSTGNGWTPFANLLLGPTMPAKLSFSGQPFLYYPENGNLMLDIVISSPVHNQTVVYTQANFQYLLGWISPETSSYVTWANGEPVAERTGLLTAFSGELIQQPTVTSLVVHNPEPRILWLGALCLLVIMGTTYSSRGKSQPQR